jgi:hypothetical protein
MRFFVTNRHNGKRYPAEGQHWPEHGWSVKIFDFSPGTWGRAETGIGDGPVIDQGFQTELTKRGWTFPELKEPENVRDQMIQKLAATFQKPSAPPAPQAPPATEGRIDWGKRLKALRIRRGELSEAVVTETLPKTVRGSGGFGSTGS